MGPVPRKKVLGGTVPQHLPSAYRSNLHPERKRLSFAPSHQTKWSSFVRNLTTTSPPELLIELAITTSPDTPRKDKIARW